MRKYLSIATKPSALGSGTELKRTVALTFVILMDSTGDNDAPLSHTWYNISHAQPLGEVDLDARSDMHPEVTLNY